MVMIDWRAIVQRKWFMSIFVTLLALTPQLCNAGSNSDESKLVTSINDFSFRFYRKLTTVQKKNFVCSPYSASVALSMLLVGAKTKTAAEISQTLGYKTTRLSIQQIQNVYHKLLTSHSKNRTFFKLAVANSLWVKLGAKLLPEYRSALKKKFFAKGKEIDFTQSSTKNEINKWIGYATLGKIPKMLKELDPETFLLLINAIYFKGQWKYIFDDKLTRNQSFHNAFSNSIKKVPMMTDTNQYRHAYIQSLKANILHLPYKWSDYSMLILLPDEKKGLKIVENKLSAKLINDAIKKSSLKETELYLPRFNLSTTVTLNDVLKKLGTKQAFTRKADLSGINGKTHSLFVSKVIQNAICEVNDIGTTLATPTFYEERLHPSIVEPQLQLQFMIDHPFLFLIRNETSGIIVFMGRVFEL